MVGRADRIWPVAAGLAGIAGEGVAIAFARTPGGRWNETALAACILAYAAVGVLILWHKPRHPIGRIAAILAPVWGVGEALVATSYDALGRDPHSATAALASVTGSFLRGLPWLVAVLWLPLVFPDGYRLDTRLAGVATRIVIGTIAVLSFISLLSPTLSDLRVGHVDNPIGVPHAAESVFGGLAALSLLFGMASLGLAVAVLVQRYRRTGALGRQQTLVFAVAFVPPVAALIASFSDAAEPWLFGIASLPVPVAIGVAVLQRRLYDIPLVINRSLTYGTLWLLIALLYAVTVGGVGAMAQQRGAPWLPWTAAGVVAVSFAPLREGLQRAANRLTYGQWAQPEEVLARTNRRLADASDMRALLRSLASDLADGMGLGYVEVRNAAGDTLAVAGGSGGVVDELPLTAYGAPVGVLRWRRRSLRDADRVLLADLTAQLGAVVHADGLLESVRAAQERLVLAREEERRRLRRDLHDGLGPTLAAIGLKVDLARERAGEQARERAGADVEELGGLLDEIRADVRSVISDVRRLARELRPPTLDTLGLAGAIGQQAAALGGGPSGPSIVVEIEERLPALPAAVEVIAYRIATEALTNVVRHAEARSCTVRLSIDRDGLVVEIEDDGRGIDPTAPSGVGRRSIDERAAEVGGEVDLVTRPGGGTIVRARLPLTDDD
jgi:signal transduction histidine kinase